MEPTVSGLEDKYGDSVRFLRLNAEEDGEAAFKAGNFPGHPAFVLLRSTGEETWRRVGIVPFEEMQEAIQTILDNQGA